MIAWILTLSRLPLAAGFALVSAIAYGKYASVASWPAEIFWLAIALAALAEFTDLFDGMAARHFNSVSTLGGLADPMCDSLGRLTVFFTLALTGQLSIAVPLTLVARDILCAYVRVVLATTGMKTSARISGKLKAGFQAAGIFIILACSRWPQLAGSPGLTQTISSLTGWIIAIATAISGVDYFLAARGAIAKMLASSKS